MTEKRVSIKDIAEKLGVSTATISLVLSGKGKDGRVGKEMTEKIKRTALAMNYKPNNLARGLRIGKTNTIGLIVADISNPFFAHMAFHIQEYAEERGYSVIIANTNESNAKMERMINILISRQVDGLIIAPTEFGETPIRNLVESKFPLVLLDRWFPNLQTHNVTINNYQASKDATLYLINKGCKKIAYLGFKTELTHMKQRKGGCVDGLKSAGLLISDLILDNINFTNMSNNVISDIDYLLSQQGKTDAIVFETNSISMIGIKELLNRGINLEKDIKIVCFDKSEAFDFTNTPIPYIHQPIPEMGQKTVDLLLRQIEKDECQFDEIEFNVTIFNI